MRRREFITLFGGTLAWPLVARAQQPVLPVIGFLSSRGERDSVNVLAAFHDGLKQAGYDENRTVATEYRWAEGQYDRLQALADDLVRRKVSLLVATGGIVSVCAAKAATATIPIVFVSAGDPVQSGLVASLSRPGGNVTGASLITVALGAKRLELLRELVPSARTIAMLINPDTPDSDPESKDVLTAAGALGRDIHVIIARSQSELEPAFAAGPTDASWCADCWRRSVLHQPARTSRSPGVALRGSHDLLLARVRRQAGIYAGQVLKGAKPSDLPVVQPTKIELVINLNTAKVLGLSLPPSLIARADEVIE